MLQRLRPKDSTTDILLVGTNRFEYFTTAWDPETSQLNTIEHFQEPGERHMRDSQSQDKCLVDPTGRYLAMHRWEGVLSMWRLGTRKNKAMSLEFLDQVRLTELFIKSSTFLYTETGHPKIAFLYQTRADATDSKLASYRLTSDDRNTEASRFDPMRDRDINLDIADVGTALLIPVKKIEGDKRHNFRNVESAKAHLGGLIVVGETMLTYIDEMTKLTVESTLKEASIFVAWAEYDATHYFLADDYGNMHLLTILVDGVAVTGMEVTKIGKTSRATQLLYWADEGLLFVGSHNGDSQLFKMNLLNTNAEDPILQLVQVMPNIAPILDFAVMDMGNRENDSQLGNEYSSGQARIVTGSGVYKDGSLRSVRSGVGLEDIGVLGELEHTRGLFPVRSHGSAKTDTLIASFLTETRVFRFDPQGDIEEVESFAGMTLDVQTLYAATLPSGQLLQVTASTVTLLDPESGIAISSWAPAGEKSITNVSANDGWLLLSIHGTSLVSIRIQNGTELQVAHDKDVSQADQIACVHVAPGLPNIGVVGFWTSGTVSLVDLNTLQPIHGESIRRNEDDTSIPRDIVLVQVLPKQVSGPTLFVAMEDGNVVSFNINAQDLTLSGRKSVVLGTREARFQLLPNRETEGLYSIFAMTEHPSLIYGSEGRVIYSAVTAEDATCVCPFDTDAFPNCIVLATESEIKISQIDTARRTHVRSLPMGETVRRLAYSPAEKVFGLGCVRRDLTDGEEIVQSSFKLVDDVLFDRVGKEFPLQLGSDAELVECVVRAELPDSYGNPAERFLVGTSSLGDPDLGPNSSGIRGRLLVFGIDSNRDPYLIASRELKGSCTCIAVMPDGKIVSALTKTVVVSQYEEVSTTEARLTRLASYRPSTNPIDLSVRGNMIAVADLMKSMTLVEFLPAGADGASSPALVEKGRHYQSAWATAVCHVGDDKDETWLEADAQGNLMVLRRNKEAAASEYRNALEITSELHLGEQVNAMKAIKVDTSPNAMIIPRAFLATVRLRSCLSST